MKQYRFTMTAFGKDIPGNWFDWDEKLFLDACRVWGLNDCMFMVEFRYV
jgi:hypothetical protein